MRKFRDQLQLRSQQLLAAVSRVEELANAPSLAQGNLDARDSLLFNLERAAWAMIELANAWIFELRLGIPRKETDAFDLLQGHGWFDLPTARRYKQLCEFRNLSSREPDRIDWKYLGGDLSTETTLFREWCNQALQYEAPRT